MEEFQKNKRKIITVLNIAIILTAIELVGNLLVDIKFTGLSMKLILTYALTALIVLGILILSKELAKKESIFGSVLTAIVGVILIVKGSLIELIFGTVFLIISVIYAVTYFMALKKNKNN